MTNTKRSLPDIAAPQSRPGVISIVAAKLHGIKVTGADLNYHGSITLDPDTCRLAGILPMEFVDIWNKTNGQRISTYVIFGESGSRCCILNGAAARTCQRGDEVIICASTTCAAGLLSEFRPRVLTFDADNAVAEVMEYVASTRPDGTHGFAINSLWRRAGE